MMTDKNTTTGEVINLHDRSEHVTNQPLEQHEIAQTRGPLLQFTGRKIAETTFNMRGPTLSRTTCQIWETKGGAYIAVTDHVSDDFEDVRAAVVEAGPDEQARRFAVMKAFQWEPTAMDMARKQLGWNFVLEIE
jgi:hypothetical protein